MNHVAGPRMPGNPMWHAPRASDVSTRVATPSMRFSPALDDRRALQPENPLSTTTAALSSDVSVSAAS